MVRVNRIIVKKTSDPEWFEYCDKYGKLANNLRNAALFRIRQIFCGYKKQDRTANEKEVFDEVALLEAETGKKVKQVIGYHALERLMRATNNADFFAGLPMQTGQAVLKETTGSFTVWLESLKDYRSHPEKYLGKPGMPNYGRKGGAHAFTITNQDAVLYPVVGRSGEVAGSELKLPLTKARLFLEHISPDADLREVKVIPYHGAYMISLTIEDHETPPEAPGTNFAAIDFGVDNIAAIVSTDASCAVFKGGAVKANNQLYAKRKAEAAAILTKGHERKGAGSHRLDRMAYSHENFSRDYLHKVSRRIVDYCVDHKVGTVVLGRNRYWKQNADMGKRNNQTFVSIPYYLLQRMIRYKAEALGIRVMDQEESYTSKVDITAMDPIHVYGTEEAKTAEFSGKRIQRGLYQCGSGLVINADCNGAANIMRKAVPDAWTACSDFGFLAFPEVFDYHTIDTGKHHYRYS